MAYSAPVAHSQSSWSILSVKVLSLTRCPWVSLVHSTTCWSSKAEHNILMHPFHMLGVAGVFGGSLFSRCTVHWLPPHWFVKPLRLSPRTTVTSSVKKKRPTTSSPHGYFGRLIFQYGFVQQLTFLHFFLACGCCRYLVHRSGCVYHGIQPERFQLQPVHR